ncbi:MAG: hypothetical protein SFX19_08440 [Alphaproteobacteria bacterium]|nr:hypothetical protein [Alphaproteobacteria bacterium]
MPDKTPRALTRESFIKAAREAWDEANTPRAARERLTSEIVALFAAIEAQSGRRFPFAYRRDGQAEILINGHKKGGVHIDAEHVTLFTNERALSPDAASTAPSSQISVHPVHRVAQKLPLGEEWLTAAAARATLSASPEQLAPLSRAERLALSSRFTALKNSSISNDAIDAIRAARKAAEIADDAESTTLGVRVMPQGRNFAIHRDSLDAYRALVERIQKERLDHLTGHVRHVHPQPGTAPSMGR